MSAAVAPDLTTMTLPPLAAKTAATPFSQEWVTLTKQAHLQLVSEAHYWKSAHERGVARAGWVARRHHHEIERARLRELNLRAELELAHAQLRDLRQRVFGAKTEQSRFVLQAPQTGPRRARGQQRGRPGHGRTRSPHLATQVENVAFEAVCPNCGLGCAQFPGVEECEVVELQVRAYKRVIRRRRYRPQCQCGCLPGIVCARPPAQLIPRGKLGVSVWVNALLSKFLYGQPTHRLLQDWSDQGLHIAQGTLTDGLHRLAPLFEPLVQAGLDRLRAQAHWHADETRWEVFAEREGKVGHRWYLWVFQAASVVHYALDPSRSAQVPTAALEGVTSGILSVDRYAAYKKFVKQHAGISLAYCWAHQRRDFLNVARDHPSLWDWAIGWTEQIGRLYRLHEQRRTAYEHRNDDDNDRREAGVGATSWARFAACDQELRQAVRDMQRQCAQELADVQLASAARKVLKSLEVHWSGLVVFVDHPWLDIDNNAAERALRTAVVGRKTYYGSGSEWSGQMAAAVMSVLMTARLWKLNARTWLTSYLQACADAGGRAPDDLSAFVPWQMDASRLAMLRDAPHDVAVDLGFDTS